MNATPPEPPPAAPAVVQAGGVFLPAEVCYPLWRILRGWSDRHRADGGQLRPELVAALDALRAAGLTHLGDVRVNGHPQRTSADIPPSSPRDLTTGEMATALRCTERHARRLAAEAGITSATRGRWRRDDVAELVATRRRE
ncbi:hypothetical protein ACQPZ8_37460 [Actinomadura nitritigenes]|uniref:hypothetical protein n=1 Tax=Actinomadura nitritigenes TaxID=134602 RepID=UPI003D92BEC2